MRASLRDALDTRMRLFELERAAGLDELSEGERNLLAALMLCGASASPVPARQLREHMLVQRLTHPTYHRTLRSLIDRGLADYVTDDNGARGYIVGVKMRAFAASAVTAAEWQMSKSG